MICSPPKEMTSLFWRQYKTGFLNACEQQQPNYPTVGRFWARWELVPESSGRGSGCGSAGSNSVSTALAKTLLFLNLYASLSGVSWRARNYPTWIEQKERQGFGILIMQPKGLKLVLLVVLWQRYSLCLRKLVFLNLYCHLLSSRLLFPFCSRRCID